MRFFLQDLFKQNCSFNNQVVRRSRVHQAVWVHHFNLTGTWHLRLVEDADLVTLSELTASA